MISIIARVRKLPFVFHAHVSPCHSDVQWMVIRVSVPFQLLCFDTDQMASRWLEQMAFHLHKMIYLCVMYCCHGVVVGLYPVICGHGVESGNIRRYLLFRIANGHCLRGTPFVLQGCYMHLVQVHKFPCILNHVAGALHLSHCDPMHIKVFLGFL